MRIRIDLKILLFFIIFYFTNQIKIYLIIMLFCAIHELGHIIMGLILKMKPEKIEIMSCGLSVSFYMNPNDKNFKIKEIFVALAGPLTSLALTILCRFVDLRFITMQEAVYSNILILFFNLMPLYPLDGGRIIKGILQLKVGSVQSEIITQKVSNITIIVLTILCSIFVYYFKNIAIFLICIFLWGIVIREKSEKTLDILQGK